MDGQVNLFAIKDGLGQEIRVGSTVLHYTKDGPRLAEVDEIGVTIGRANPDKPVTKLKLTGRRNDAKYIAAPVTVANTGKLMVLEAAPDSTSQDSTSPGAPAAPPFRVPRGAESILVGSPI